MAFGPRAGAAHEESAALAAAGAEPVADGPRPGAFVSCEEAKNRILALLRAHADLERLSEAALERVVRRMMANPL